MKLLWICVDVRGFAMDSHGDVVGLRGFALDLHGFVWIRLDVQWICFGFATDSPRFCCGFALDEPSF